MNDSTQNVEENEKLSSALNQIFSNPQMLSAISSMAQSLKSNNSVAPPVEASATEKEKSEPPPSQSASAIPEKLPELLNMLSQNSSGIKQSHRSELLCALKPYLSQSRSDAIDKIIRFSELSSVFKALS
jgi:hypothetical protein